jgi:PAS domain S-box-containing protein
MTELSHPESALETTGLSPSIPAHQAGDVEGRVSELLPHLAAGIVVLAADQTISSWNPRAEELTGYTFREVKALGLESLFEPVEILHHILRKAQEGLPTLSEYMHLKHVDGRLVPVGVQCSPQRRMGRTDCQIVLAFRSLEPVRQRLRRDDHLMMLGRLASSLSHEIRNPLNAIFLHVDIVEEELQQPTRLDNHAVVLESLAEIKQEIGRVNDLVQDYLSLARLSTLQREPQKLGAVMEELAPEMTELLLDQGMTCQLEGVESLGQVALHRNTFRRVLLNLVQNAIDAMPQGGTLILRGRQDASHVYLEISDTGSGIPEEQLPLLFTPFHTTKPEGTGLGLYVVQEIVAAHEGEIAVTSEPGVGTTFTVTLPLVTADASIPG